MEVLSINPWWYRRERELVAKIIQVQNEKLAELCAKAAGPARRVCLARIAVSGPRRAAARRRGAQVRAQGRGHRRQRGGRRILRSEISSGVGESRGTRRDAVHPPAKHAGTRQALQGQRLAVERDRQSARHHDRAAAPDFRRHARQIPAPEGLRRARRRLPGIVRAAFGPRLFRLAAELQSGHRAQEKTDRVPEPDIFRLARLHAGSAAPSRRTGRREPGRHRHRPPDSVERASGRPHHGDEDALGRRRRPRSSAAMRRSCWASKSKKICGAEYPVTLSPTGRAPERPCVRRWYRAEKIPRSCRARRSHR